MKFTVRWLKEYLACDLPAGEIADRLTMLGLEVDSVTELFANLAAVKVCRVLSVERHPNADKLTVCQVEAGSGPLQIICGAPNVEAGMISALALPGATLPGGLTIREAKIRGIASSGMLCSEKDLGISEEHGGIMQLPADLPVGADLAEALELRDTVIEVDLTPNRPDCTSVIGIAREVAGTTGGQLTQPVAALPALAGAGLPFSVTVENVEDCPRYAARLITGVQIGPSPWWLRRRLLAVGLRPINNVVDITNYVMLEYGQPLHAFDFDLLAGHAVVVRRSRPGEAITTLDGVERKPEADALLICDAEKPIAVAGVMGGGNSEVNPATTSILLESACFNPVSVRRTARKLKMGTDASYRFERGVDPELAPRALERAVQLICAIAGGTAVEGGVDCRQGDFSRRRITIRARRTNELLGISLSTAEIAALLGRIEIATTPGDAESLVAEVPCFRVDLEREVDLIEEVARLYGYNRIPTALPAVPMRFPEKEAARDLRQQVSRIMSAMGFFEAINYSFTDPGHFDRLGLAATDPARAAVQLLNPLAEEQSVMRTMLLPQLLENLCRNLSFQKTDVRLFEVGKVFTPSGAEQPTEEQFLVAVMSGRRYPESPVLYFGETTSDFHDIRGAAEQLCAELRIASMEFSPPVEALPFADPGHTLTVRVGDVPAGYIGKARQDVLKRFGIKQDAFFLVISLDALQGVSRTPRAFQPLPRFPWVRWDIAVLVPEQVQGGAMLDGIRALSEPLVQRVDIFDVYRGKPIEEGYKSVALTVTYRSAEKTLDEATVGKVHQRIVELIQARFHGRLREA